MLFRSGESGSKLSGGQRQRIGIARALYHDPAILAFDEVTNGLDANLENQFIKTISHLKGTITMIMITHKLNTLKLCDRIMVFKNGQIIDDSHYDILQERCDIFRGLLSSTDEALPSASKAQKIHPNIELLTS